MRAPALTCPLSITSWTVGARHLHQSSFVGQRTGARLEPEEEVGDGERRRGARE